MAEVYNNIFVRASTGAIGDPFVIRRTRWTRRFNVRGIEIGDW